MAGGWGDFSTTSSTLGYSTTLSTTSIAPTPFFTDSGSSDLTSALAFIIGVPIALLVCCIGCGAGCGILCYRQCRNKKKPNAQQMHPQVVVVNQPMPATANPLLDPQPSPPPYESLHNARESGQYWEISEAEAARQSSAPCPRPADRINTYLELTAVSPRQEESQTSADYLKPVQQNSGTDPEKAYDYVVSMESDNGMGTASEGYLTPESSYDDTMVQASAPQENTLGQKEHPEDYLKPVQPNSTTDPEKAYDYAVSKENQNGKGTVDEGYLAPKKSYDNNALPTLVTDEDVATTHQNLSSNIPQGNIQSVPDQNRGQGIPTEFYHNANPQLVVDQMQGSEGSLDHIPNPSSAAPVSHQDGYLAPVSGRNCSDPEGYSYATKGQQDLRPPSSRPAGALSSAQDYLDMNKPPSENPDGHYRNEALMHGHGKTQSPMEPGQSEN